MKRVLLFLATVFAALPGAALAVDANTCGYNQGNGGWYKAADRSGPYSLDGNCNATLLGGPGSAPAAPTYTTPAGLTRTRQVCTLPAYATGGNIVCTDQAGAQTTTACAANTACLVSAASPGRKVAEFTNRTAGSTIDVGYSATTAPGNSKGYDGPSATNGQGGSGTENPAHVGAYYAASNTAGAVLVFVQGQ